jgi:hypothetical protein
MQTEEQAKQYTQLRAELQPFMKMIGAASDTIVEQEVSSYPIFVLHKGEIELGIVLKDYEGVWSDWGINASTLEEFVVRQIIKSEKVDDFKSIYKPANSHICLFVLSESGATFVFLPRS